MSQNVDVVKRGYDAFNSGDGLRWLDPGDRFAMTWGISASLER